MSKNFYLTTTLPYVNADLHMGHALEFVRADIIARSKKAEGYEVFFNTGTDEHGMKIYEKAVANGQTPQEFVDASFARFQDSVKIFGLDESIIHYARTTNPSHEKAAQEFWRRCDQNGYIYKKNYQTKYCVGCEEAKTDSELVNGECPVHPGRALEIIEEENYFFKYSAFTDKLTAFYATRPDFVVPDFRFNEIKAFVARGLEDFSISRLKTKMPWGIPVPGDDNHVMYVWFDALTNYISTLGWPDAESVASGDFKKFWVEGTPTQYCGKDNLRFQSAMWQAMLMAADVPNSHQIVINGFITADGGVKMSKTLGNVVDPKDIVAEYGTDALRFFLAKEISSFEDSPFTPERFKAAYNAHLANGIGNLSSRILTLSEKHLSKCPSLEASVVPEQFIQEIHAFDIQKATTFVWSKVQELDQTIQSTEPFKVVKLDEVKGKELITDLVVKLNTIALMLQSIMPATATKILAQIQANKKPEAPLFLRKE
ncbi:MAG: methionine--tRNA ligase [bacterium]